MTQGNVPRIVYFIALFVSFAMAGATVVLFLAIGPSLPTSWLVPPLISATGSLTFALTWPAGSWRWGIWLSAGFLAFFAAVFFSYLLTDEFDLPVLGRAASVLAAGVFAAALGSRASRRRRVRIAA